MNGLRAKRPVGMPCFSMAPTSPASRALCLLPQQVRDLRPQCGIASGEVGHQGCSGASWIEVAPKMVSTRVVNTGILSPAFPPALRAEIPPARLRCVRSSCAAWCAPFRPAAELVQAIQQLLRVVGGAQEPLFQFTLFYRRGFVPPATAVYYLLVSQNRGAFGTPVHLALLTVGQTLFVELEKEPLVPAVIVRQAGGYFLRPVVGEADTLHLGLHVGDIVEGPFLGGNPVLDGGVLGRQAERIPAHRVKDVVAAHPHVAGQSVADRVVPHMSHVQDTTGVRKHLEYVILFLL